VSITGTNEVSCSVVLDDGRELRVREVRPIDTPALQAMHHDLSSRTVYQRFFAVLPELPLDQAEHFTHVDGNDRVAIVAETADGQLVAVARYDRLPPDGRRAEVAFVVLDEYQRHGLGTALARLLVAHARDHGVDVLVADVLATNSAMFHVFTGSGLHPSATYECGVAHLEMPLVRAAPGHE
jgi:RimJ/RimL family protein N-acetyltransferase